MKRSCRILRKPARTIGRKGIELILIGILVGPVLTRGDTVNFDSYVSPADNDLVNLFNNPGTFTQTQSGGITGGAVQASGFASTPMYTTSFNPLGSLTTSVFMRYENVNSGTPGSGGASLRLGFNGSATERLDILSGTAYFWGEFYNDGGLTIWSKGSGNGNGFNPVGTIVPPAFGNWLKLTFSASYLGAAQFLLSTALEDYGPTGMDAPIPLTAGTITVANSAAAADTSVYAGFGGYYHVSAFDNFAVVPEPAPFQVTALGGLIVVLVWFRGRTRTRPSTAPGS